MENNTVYDCSRDYGRRLVSLTGGPATVGSFSGNTLYAIGTGAFTLGVDNAATLASPDNNRFYHPFRDTQISADGSKTFEQWQTYSGLDGSSEKNWFSLGPGNSPVSSIFYNDSGGQKTFDLEPGRYVDLEDCAMLLQFVSGNRAPF